MNPNSVIAKPQTQNIQQVHHCHHPKKLNQEELKTNIFDTLVIGRSKNQSADYVTNKIFNSVQENIDIARELDLPTEKSEIRKQLVNPWLNQSSKKTGSIDEKFWNCMDDQNAFFKSLSCAASVGMSVASKSGLAITAAAGSCGDLAEVTTQCYEENQETK